MRVAIQGERGSNSHMAATAMLGGDMELLPCALSVDVFEALAAGTADAAVLPIENSLHGAVAEHYDLLLERDVRIEAEGLVRIVHNLIAPPGVELAALREVLSHPVALSQCRRWFEAHRDVRPVAFYDTAGSVKHLIEHPRADAAALAPLLAAEVYGGSVLATGIEDNAENFTRFHLLRTRAQAQTGSAAAGKTSAANKMTVAFSLEHRPGSLVAALAALAAAGVDLTRIESRPVQGRPWEYIFFVDFRFYGPQGDAALEALAPLCRMVRELGRYAAAAA